MHVTNLKNHGTGLVCLKYNTLLATAENEVNLIYLAVLNIRDKNCVQCVQFCTANYMNTKCFLNVSALNAAQNDTSTMAKKMNKKKWCID